MLQNLKTGDDVHFSRLEGNGLGRSQPVVDLKPGLSRVTAGRLEGTRGDVRAEYNGAAPGEKLAGVPAAAAHIEDFQPVPISYTAVKIGEAQGVGPVQYGITPARRPPFVRGVLKRCHRGSYWTETIFSLPHVYDRIGTRTKLVPAKVPS
jgi:hypothetical protein